MKSVVLLAPLFPYLFGKSFVAVEISHIPSDISIVIAEARHSLQGDAVY